MRTDRYVLVREIPYLPKKKSSPSNCKSKAKKCDSFYTERTVLLKYKNLDTKNNFIGLSKLLCRIIKLVAKMSTFFAVLFVMLELLT